MKLFSNPVVLRMALVLFASGFSFFMAVIMIRRMRRSLGEDEMPQSPASLEHLPMHMYHAVIQQLKQQKHELQTQQQAEHRRARTSENVSAAILSNLSSGVLFFGANGLVRQANQAAKTILGVASPAGMNAENIFRGASLVRPPKDAPGTLADAVQRAIAEGSSLKRVEVYYLTPDGTPRVIEVTISAVRAAEGGVLGVACLLDDQSEVADLRRQMELRGEMSAEMALGLRNSLVTISGYAQQLAKNRDPDLAQQLASDIANEANHLDRTIGGFLAGSRNAQAARNGL
jgi:nitrogen fixation/metabolism regulation signal transduction histidine kinase